MQPQKIVTGSFDAGKIKGILLIILVLALTLVHSGCVGLAGSNTMPMLLSNPAPSNVSPSSATISWTTNVLATSQVEYGTTISYGLKTALDPALVTNHAQTLTALAASTTYHYRVHSRDANSLETVSKDFALTTPATAGTPPPSVSITAPAQGATVSGTVVVSTSVSSNTVSVQFRVDGTDTGSPVTAAPFSYSLDTTTLSNGSHAISAVASNASAQTATASVTVNVNNLAPPTPPTPPTISITSPAQGATVSGTVVVSTSVSSNTVSVQFRVDGTNTGSPVTAAPFSYSLDTTTLSNGSHAISAVASNASAQTATASVTVNVNNLAPPMPPTISITSPASGATVSGTVIVSTSVSSNTVRVQFRVDGINTGSPVTAAPFSYSLDTTTLSNGSHAVSAVASNASAQTATASVTVNVNNLAPPTPPTPPTISITSPAQGATVSGTVIISTSVSSNTVSVQFRVDGTNTGSPVTAAPFSYSLDTTTLSNGSHAISAVASNASAQTATASVTVNVNNLAPPTPPTISITSPASGATVSGTVIVSTSVSSNTVRVQFRVDGINTGSPVTAAPFSYSLDTTTLSNGSHAISAVASNASAQTATASVTINVTNSTPPGGGTIPGTPGWYDVPNTLLQSVCPPDSGGYAFSFRCQDVIRGWSGGVGDTKRNRLIIWGGGHSGYFGNEVYAFDLNTLKLTRLNNPSPIASGTGCPTTLADGTPNSRHTYNGLTYIAHADKMFVFGGAPANMAGCFQNDTWTLDLGTLQWRRMDPTSGGPPKGILAGTVAAYDPNSRLVYLDDRYDFWSYNFDTNTYTRLGSGADNGLYVTSVIDTKRKLWVVFGGGTVATRNIAPGADVSQQKWTTSGCSGLVSSGSPGLAYDAVQDRIVGWPNFGNTVYVYNPDTKTCTTQTYGGGPADSAHAGPAPSSNGTFGRFQYFPALNVFAVVNDWNIDAHTLRLTAGGTPPPSGPVISGVTASSITTSGATISWTTDVPATTQMDYGTTGAYGLSTTLDLTLSASHAQSLTGLAAGTLYHYRVRSRDAGGVETISGDFAFSTNTGVITPPPSVALTAPVSGATVSGTVTVSAVASDTVGVVGVQFLLDAAPLGAEVTVAPYYMLWDTTTAVNGSHLLAATARNAGGGIATSITVAVTVSNSAPPGPTADFAARCAAPGVVRCFKPEDPVFVRAHLHPGDGGVYRGEVDTVIKASGVGSLKFTVPSNTGTAPGGELWLNFTEDLSTQFGSGDEFWVQWRQRFSTEFVTNAWSGNGWKQIIVGEGDRPGFSANSCTSMHLVVENTYMRNAPQMYHSCGFKDNLYEPFSRFNATIGTYDIQPNLGCSHVKTTVPPCVVYQPNQWMTFMLHVKPGTWYLNNHVYKHDGTMELYVAEEGKPSTLTINFKPVGDAACDAQQVSIPASCTTGYDFANANPAAAKYGKLWLLPYMTGHTPQTLPTGYTWYDEIIISRQRIADPK